MSTPPRRWSSRWRARSSSPAPAVAGTPAAAAHGRRVANGSLGAIVVLWAAATFTFFVQALLPGNRATLLLNEQTGQQKNYSSAQLAARSTSSTASTSSLIIQYLDYIGGLAHGNLGTSYTQHQPVLTIISARGRADARADGRRRCCSRG